MAADGIAQRDAYLARLGVAAGQPSVDALFALHRAHVEQVPYETLWLQLGEPWSIDTGESTTRISTRHRGGYCFHLNGAFGELLRALGYDVERHVGGVHGPDGPSGDEMANHLVLTVRGLPSEANPDGAWYVDVGLGDALHEPLPLIAGAYDQGPFRLTLDATTNGIGDWHLTHDPDGWFTGMSWCSDPAARDAFDAKHTEFSTSPESGFVKTLIVLRRDAGGVDHLRGLVLKRIGAGAAESTITTGPELIDVLGDRFGFDVGEIDTAARAELWERVLAAHEAWEAAGGP